MKSLLKSKIWILHDDQVFVGDTLLAGSSKFIVLDILENTIKIDLELHVLQEVDGSILQTKDNLQHMRKRYEVDT